MIKKRLLKTFLELIKIDEIYPQEKEIVSYVLEWFKKLKIPTRRDSFGNIIAYLKGRGSPLMLNTHLDIPENVHNLDFKIEGHIIRATGKSILGADPKSGLAVLLELAKYVKENNFKTYPVEFVFTLGEEAGLLGALNLDYSLINSKMGLVIDEDGPCTNVVIRAPGYYRLDVEFIGKTVHPRDWKMGNNALETACKAVSLLKQGEIVKGVTFNVGILQGGTARNSVPGKAILKAELRSFDDQKLIKQAKKIETIFKVISKKRRTEVRINGQLEFKSYCLSKNHKLFRLLEKTYKKMELKPNYYETFGGSDANIFNSKGIVTVPIGSAYYCAHQYTEYVDVLEMEKLFSFLLNFIKRKD